MEHLVQTARSVDMELRLLFDGTELDRLKRMPRSAQISALEDFWAAHDPTPGTEANETYALFQQRVEEARRRFSEQGLPGPLTDRGRTYIRYGAPAEIQFDLLPNDEKGLAEAIVKVHDESQVDRYGTVLRGEIPLNLDRLEVQQDLERYTPGSASAQAAYELWIYDIDGDPLFDEGPVWPEGLNLRFLFVDVLGTGVYRLEFSNYPFRKE
jgi:GWxTD domain-containing protein